MGMNCYIYHARARLYTQSYVQETIQICTELSGNRRDTIILTSGNTLHYLNDHLDNMVSASDLHTFLCGSEFTILGQY